VARVVVAGIDGITGANLAAWLGEHHQVCGFSFSRPIAIEGCETRVCPTDDPDAVHSAVQDARPEWLIYCGPAAESAWCGAAMPPEFQAIQWARPWARAAAQFNCALTAISSDAVFTGPWMFHQEDGNCHCESPAARAVLAVEQEIAAAHQNALIVRTNTFGWSPLRHSAGFVGNMLKAAETQIPMELDCTRHATPILATDLAGVLNAAFEGGLRGLYHAGGAERVNPYRFGALVTDEFACDFVANPISSLHADRRDTFGGGESSLQSRAIREALGIALPLLRDGLKRMHAQQDDGFSRRFVPEEITIHEMVA
jgi:dTDP-4-dehydrorhamnose reductase